ncbi:hypothetical protein BGX26_008470 [Mortierella sp. AD094]|nr:hypothetical protein BGX26_008470 [Mortierella sp. AD094]
MRDLFHTTPKDLISKVFLEEMVFQTWYHGRSVLIGDACHKLLPGGGEGNKLSTLQLLYTRKIQLTVSICMNIRSLGAVMAMKDAVVLANCLYNMRDKSDKSIKMAFTDYYRQRYLDAEDKVKSSAIFTRIMLGHKWTDRLLREVVAKYYPNWLKWKVSNMIYANRPQINWLPLVEDLDLGHVLLQEGRELNER